MEFLSECSTVWGRGAVLTCSESFCSWDWAFTESFQRQGLVSCRLRKQTVHAWSPSLCSRARMGWGGCQRMSACLTLNTLGVATAPSAAQQCQCLRGDGVRPHWQDGLLSLISLLWDFLLLALKQPRFICSIRRQSPPHPPSCVFPGAASHPLVAAREPSDWNVSPGSFNHLSSVQGKFWVQYKKLTEKYRNGMSVWYLNIAQEGLICTKIHLTFFPKNNVGV